MKLVSPTASKQSPPEVEFAIIVFCRFIVDVLISTVTNKPPPLPVAELLLIVAFLVVTVASVTYSPPPSLVAVFPLIVEFNYCTCRTTNINTTTIWCRVSADR